jgi:hypothetical protein
MKNIIVITGASSGFGALAARALAIAGHSVYASMRETTGRNAAQVEAAKQFAAENGVDLRTIERMWHLRNQPTRPSRRLSRKTAVSMSSSTTRDPARYRRYFGLYFLLGTAPGFVRQRRTKQLRPGLTIRPHSATVSGHPVCAQCGQACFRDSSDGMCWYRG